MSSVGKMRFAAPTGAELGRSSHQGAEEKPHSSLAHFKTRSLVLLFKTLYSYSYRPTHINNKSQIRTGDYSYSIVTYNLTTGSFKLGLLKMTPSGRKRYYRYYRC